jgi:hypothetical protein
MKSKFKHERDRSKVKAKRFLKTMQSVSTMFDDWVEADAVNLFSDRRQSR